MILFLRTYSKHNIIFSYFRMDLQKFYLKPNVLLHVDLLNIRYHALIVQGVTINMRIISKYEIFAFNNNFPNNFWAFFLPFSATFYEGF